MPTQVDSNIRHLLMQFISKKKMFIRGEFLFTQMKKYIIG